MRSWHYANNLLDNFSDYCMVRTVSLNRLELDLKLEQERVVNLVDLRVALLSYSLYCLGTGIAILGM